MTGKLKVSIDCRVVSIAGIAGIPVPNSLNRTRKILIARFALNTGSKIIRAREKHPESLRKW